MDVESCEMSDEHPDKQYRLRAETELRFVVSIESEVTLILKEGLAEIFGTELTPKKEYVFESKACVSVFTWQGCLLTLSGSTETDKVIKDTPMIVYVNLHAALEHMRQTAEEKGHKGPAVLVVGPTDVGKSTLCKFLVNYAVRQGRTPIFADLDVGQGQIAVPGTIGAILAKRTAEIGEGYHHDSSLIYHMGHKSPGHNIVLYNGLLSRLAAELKSRIKPESSTYASGIIINTCGWVKNDGYMSLTKAIFAFEVDVVLVLGAENIFHQMSRDVPSFVKVVYVPKFKAVIERSRTDRFEERDNRVCTYFYGYRKQLQPHSIQLDFSEVEIYKIVQKRQPFNKLPNGAKELDDGLLALPVEAGFNLLNRVLTITFESTLDKDTIYKNIAGFICVTQVDVRNHVLTILSPQPAPFHKAILLYSDVLFTREL